jgi:hypothetical protein
MHRSLSHKIYSSFLGKYADIAGDEPVGRLYDFSNKIIFFSIITCKNTKKNGNY